jgi:hypothetical protein
LSYIQIFDKANIVGLIVSAGVLVPALNLTPGLQVSMLWQLGAVVALCITNLVVWRHNQIPPMSIRDALLGSLLYLAIVAVIAVIDTLMGFAFGANTVIDAFVNSGAFGGIVDAFLFLCGIFIGIPTVSRSIYLYYREPSPQLPSSPPTS